MLRRIFSAPSDLRDVMVIQQGARRNYTYAVQLESEALLHSIGTDAAWSKDSRGLIKYIGSRFFSRREIRNIEIQRIYTTITPNLITFFLRNIVSQEKIFSIIDNCLGISLCLRIRKIPKVIVNYAGNGGIFLKFARKRGAKIVTDFVITPLHLEIQRTEYFNWPNWESNPPSLAEIEYYRKRTYSIIKESDLCFCPSQTVARDLRDSFSVDPAKILIMPYGTSRVLVRQQDPVPGRVLFSGAAGLRKGIPYLADAALRLKEICPEIEIRVAGTVTDIVRLKPETRALNFLGHLNREEMADEMSRADIFCLPTLAEGSATAIFEALANGIPVVTTASSGSIIRNEAEGIIVPERDGHAIARALCRIVRDRELRARMSLAALASAREYSDDRCGDIFIRAIREIMMAQSSEEHSA
jgi:glycosyltransferase involved in cell wall biosynthesis